jgi:RNA polymerase sigma factor (sigma-70 family)
MSNTADLKKQVEIAYRKNRGRFLSRVKRATRNILDAEDIVHEAFVKALSNLNVIEKVENLSAWLFTVIRNLIIDMWRSRRSRALAGEKDIAEETIAEIIAATGLDPADELIRNELADAITEAITALPEKQRAVIEAQILDNLTFRELSEKNGESINTLMTRKKLAVKKLATALHDWIEE